MMLVNASGHIKLYSSVLGLGNSARCLAVLILLWLDFPLIFSLWIGWFSPFFVICQVRVWFASRVVGLSIREYLQTILLPVFEIALGSFGLVILVKTFAGDSLTAMLGTVIANGAIVFVLLWITIGASERSIIHEKFRRLCGHIK
jgi:hypothetical protein